MLRARMLEDVGISELEEHAYLLLLRRGRASSSELADAVGVGDAEILPVLELLEAKGLVSRVPGTPMRFLPAPPQLAIEGLVNRQRDKLERIRPLGAQLEREFRDTLLIDRAVDLVEVITTKQAVYERLLQLHRSARAELLSLSKPPYVTPSAEDPVEIESLTHDVRHRVIYDRAAFEIPGELEGIEQNVLAGEEARVLTDVPMKLLIVDHNIGLVPLSIQQEDVGAALLVHSSALLDALVIMFESLWERAVPLGVDGAREGVDDELRKLLSAEQKRLVTLMVAGSKDAVIARQLGVAPRTLRRRVADLLDVLEAANRFQAGYQACRRGLL